MSQQTYLATVNDSAKLKSLKERMTTEKNNFIREINLLKQKADNENEKYTQARKQIWDDFIEELKTKGQLPSEYNDGTHYLEINDKTGQIFMCEKQPCGHEILGKALSKLLN